MDREAIEEAIEVLEDASAEMLAETGDENYYSEAIAILRQALKIEQKTAVSPGKGTGFNYFRASAITVLRQPQEPVAWRTFDGEGGYDYRSYEMNENYGKEWAERNPNHAHWVEPLYTSPQKQWVGLTDEEVAQAMYRADAIITGPMQFRFAKEIEAKLKEKNHG